MRIRRVKSKTPEVFIINEESEVIDYFDSITISNKTIVDAPEKFVFLFNPIVSLLEVVSPTGIKIMLWLFLNCEYETNLMHLGIFEIKKIGEKLNIKEGTVRNAISELVKHGVLVKIERAVYLISPKYSWKGDRSIRGDAMLNFLQVKHPNFDKGQLLSIFELSKDIKK